MGLSHLDKETLDKGLEAMSEPSYGVIEAIESFALSVEKPYTNSLLDFFLKKNSAVIKALVNLQEQGTELDIEAQVTLEDAIITLMQLELIKAAMEDDAEEA